jgi:hypothetical protein
MRHRYLFAAVLVLSIGPAAQAQPPPSEPVSPTPAEEARTGDQADVSAVAADFRPGMLVKDPSGFTVGSITRVTQTANGATAVEVDVDGRRMSLAPSILSLNARGDGALSSMTKAEIQAASARAPD